MAETARKKIGLKDSCFFPIVFFENFKHSLRSIASCAIYVSRQRLSNKNRNEITLRRALRSSHLIDWTNRISFICPARIFEEREEKMVKVRKRRKFYKSMYIGRSSFVRSTEKGTRVCVTTRS